VIDPPSDLRRGCMEWLLLIGGLSLVSLGAAMVLFVLGGMEHAG
jgi:hypothetical protein